MKETVGRSIGMLSNLIRRHFSTFSFHDTLSPAQGKTLHFILARSMDTDVFQKDVEEEYSLRPPTATKGTPVPGNDPGESGGDGTKADRGDHGG